MKDRIQLEELLQRKSAELSAANARLQQEIIDRIETEIKLRQEIHLNKILLNNMPCAAILARPGTREIVAANEMAIKAGAVPGKQCFATLGQQKDPCPWCLTPRLWDAGKTERLEVEVAGIVWDVYWLPVSDDLYMRYAFDITERKKLEKSLIETEERERRRIGQDLHDELGQLLTGISFKTSGLVRKLENSCFEGAEDAAAISILVGKAKKEVSRMSKGLLPVETDKEGLMTALEELADHTEEMFGIPCGFKCDKPVTVRNKTAVAQLYRIAQEAVTNAVKHGKPKKVEVFLAEEHDKISLIIKDDGTGMPELSRHTGGMGLKIMNYRAGIINGTFNIRRDIKGGTIATCIFPAKPGEKIYPKIQMSHKISGT